MTTLQGRWCSLILALAWTFWFFGSAVWQPDAHVFGGVGDGMKNYYTFAYHVRHDAHWMHFEGCNYPYGDHVTFTDGHPALSFLFGSLPWVQAHPVGFLNLFMIVGFTAGLLLLYQLLIVWGASPAFALAGAWIIHLGHPQLERLSGHLSLSAVWMIPLMLLLLALWRQHTHLKYIFCAALLHVFAWFLHPYLGLMMGGLMILFPLLASLFARTQLKGWWLSAGLGILIMGAYFFFVRWTDHHPDRPQGGGGFLDFVTTFKTLFGGMDGNLIGRLFGSFAPWPNGYEGKAYIGFVPMLGLVAAILWGARHMKKVVAVVQPWMPWIIIAICFVAFASAVPFIWGLEKWVSKVPFLEHFRCPGRFAWVFYYIVTCAAWLALYGIVKSQKKLGWVVLWTCPLIATADHVHRQQRVSASLLTTPNYFHTDYIPAEDIKPIQDILSQAAQTTAIWTVPQICYGSDFFTRYFDEEKVRHAYIVSFHTGKPLLGTFNPRASYTESRWAMQLTAPNVFAKDMWADWKPTDRFYLLKLDEPKFEGEQRLLAKCGSWITPEEEESELKSCLAAIDYSADRRVWNVLEPASDERGFLQITQSTYQPIAEWNTDTLSAPCWMHASAWMDYDTYTQGSVYWMVEEKQGDKNKLLDSLYSHEASFQFGKKVWLSSTFKVQPDRAYMVLFRYGDKDRPYIHFSQFELQEVDSVGQDWMKYRSLWSRFKAIDLAD